MVVVVFWLLAFCVTNALSIVLMGDRSLISGNLLDMNNLMRILVNWKFIVAMFFAVVTRINFIMLNNSLLKIPRLADASTTIAAFATLLSLIFIVATNYFFLNEKLNVQQAFGAFIVLIGVCIMVK